MPPVINNFFICEASEEEPPPSQTQECYSFLKNTLQKTFKEFQKVFKKFSFLKGFLTVPSVPAIKVSRATATGITHARRAMEEEEKEEKEEEAWQTSSCNNSPPCELMKVFFPPCRQLPKNTGRYSLCNEGGKNLVSCLRSKNPSSSLVRGLLRRITQ